MTFSRTVPGTLWNADVENQEPKKDRSQNDPYPEVELLACHASNLTDLDPDEYSHMSQHVCGSGRQTLLTRKNVFGPSTDWKSV